MRRRGRPAKITRADIIATAADMGLDRFSMHQVAERLGVTTPALYSHVANREQIVALAATDVLGDLGDTLGQRVDWRTWLTDWAAGLRDRLGHLGPEIIEALPIDADGVGAAERGIVLMTDAGFTPVQAGQALWLMTRLAVTAQPHTGAAAPTVGAARAALDALPSQEMAEAMDAVEALEAQAAFEFDVAVILAGLERQLGPHATSG